MIAALYDVHGNLPALDAVIADAEAHGADRFVLGGDYAAFGAWPLETVFRLRELLDAVWIAGNWERWQAYPTRAPDNDVVQGAAQAVRTALPPELVAEHATLPQTTVVDGVRFCHASPGSDMDGFTVPAHTGAGTDELDRELLAGCTEELVVCGHTHVQFERVTATGVRLLNPGSVGLPWDGDTRAAYALLREDQTVILRRVEYDLERSAAALELIGERWASTTAARLRSASFDAR